MTMTMMIRISAPTPSSTADMLMAVSLIGGWTDIGGPGCTGEPAPGGSGAPGGAAGRPAKGAGGAGGRGRGRLRPAASVGRARPDRRRGAWRIGEARWRAVLGGSVVFVHPCHSDACVMLSKTQPNCPLVTVALQ